MMSGDIRILFLDDAPMDVMFEQKELTRYGLAFEARIDNRDQAQGYLLTPPTSASESHRLMKTRWGAREAVPQRIWQ
jgi:hypothetical protein